MEHIGRNATNYFKYLISNLCLDAPSDGVSCQTPSQVKSPHTCKTPPPNNKIKVLTKRIFFIGIEYSKIF